MNLSMLKTDKQRAILAGRSTDARLITKLIEKENKRNDATSRMPLPKK